MFSSVATDFGSWTSLLIACDMTIFAINGTIIAMLESDKFLQ